MKSLLLLVSILFVGTFTSVKSSRAQDIPRTISYQGVLQTSEGAPATGVEPMTIRLYSDSAGTQLVWEDVFTPNVQNGVFNVVLGSQKPLPSATQMNVPLWLAVSVGGGEEMKPYSALATSPYALNAASANALAPGAQGAVTSINEMAGDLTIKAGTGTSIETDGNTITISAASSSNSKGGKDQPLDVAQSIIGTNHQVYADGTYGVEKADNVTLSLPQNIDSVSTPHFVNISLNNIPSGSADTNILVSNGGALQTRTISSIALPNFTSVLNTASPNSSSWPVVQLLATNSATNVDVALSPKGNGALLAQVPDGTAADGNKRGTFSVDWQMGRNFSSQVASGSYASIGGGVMNTSSNIYTAVAGGYDNVASGAVASVAGGEVNSASGNVAFVGGGWNNIASAKLASVGGGRFNTASGEESSVSGGWNNFASGFESSVGGGLNDTASGINASVGGGIQNVASGQEASVGGGNTNTASGYDASVGGGYGNTASVVYATVGGGESNTAGGEGATIAGGQANQAIGQYAATIAGGGGNIAGGTGSSVGGGWFNNAIGDYSSIIGGAGLTLSGTGSFGFLGNNTYNGGNNATISASNVGYLGNVDLWLGNNDGSARGLYFYAPNSTTGPFPGTTAYTSFKAQSQSSNITYTLPASQGAASTVLANDGSGNLSWASSTATAWELTGNAGTTAGTNFVGTTDTAAFEIRSNNARVMRFENFNPGDGPNVIGGSYTNAVSAGNHRSTIGGGWANTVSGDAGTIGGGSENNAGGLSFIGGGAGNVASNGFSVLVGGQQNSSGTYAFVGGGTLNQANNFLSAVVGGAHNIENSGASFIGSGEYNTISGGNSSIVGGDSNTVDGNVGWAFIGGGHKNFAGARYSAIGGGSNNATYSAYGAVGGGLNNRLVGDYSAIPGGRDLNLGFNSFGFNGDNSGTKTDLYLGGGGGNMAYFGNVNLWLGNVDGTARQLRFYAPNTDHVYGSGTYFTSFVAQSQSANITYTLPASQGAANTVLANDGSGVLSWATARKNWVSVPSSSTASGMAGDEAYDSSYLYICVATNTWERTALSSW